MMLGGGESDQRVVDGAAENLPGGDRGEEFLVGGPRQSEKWLGEPLGDEGMHNRRAGTMRWREAGQHGVGLDRGVRDQARSAGRGLAGYGVMFVPAGERGDNNAGID